MMRPSVIEFDPYPAWLRIQATNRPLNAYQLLGLKELEADQSRIRSAIERQTLALDRCRTEADEELWNRVSEELAGAARTLLDPELKAVLDGGLRRSSVARSADQTDKEPVEGAQGSLQCASCGTSNASHRRFCGACGQSLRERCPQCDAECPCDERFCGHCGFDIRSGVEQRNDAYRQQLAEARKLAANHLYERALSLLRKLAAIDDKRFARWAELALEEIAKTEQQAAALKAQAERSLITARQRLREFAYDQAADALVCVPEPLRTDEINALLREARDAKSELASLNVHIRQAVAQKSLWNLLPQIQRLLTLKPDDAPVQKLALQLRDHFVRLAKAKLATHEYAEAGQALQQIAPLARTDEVDSLSDKTQELDSLMQNLRCTAIADQAALALGRKLVKYAPSNHVAQKLLADLDRQAKSPAADPRLAVPNGAAPDRTPLGMPVDWLGHFTGVVSANAEIAETLQQHPGEFFIALGLALQGVDEAHIPLNLAPAEKASVLGKLNLGRLRAKPASAWGIDLGNFGLRALKLSRDPKSGQVQIEGCEHIPHSTPLTAPSAELERSNIVEQTLRTFLERTKTAGARVVVNIPGQRVLGRFFELPPLPAAKLAGAVQFEAKHQLPIALEELCWAYQMLGTDAGDERGANVLLAAARQAHVRDCLAPFKSLGITVDAVQSDCLALHNAVQREFFSDGTALAADDVLAFVEMGAEGTNVVFSSRDTTWFRSFGLAGNSFTNVLVRHLQLTYEQAEQWKREPARARRFYHFQAALQPLLAQLAGELERSIASYRKLYPSHRIRHLYGLGGAFGTHGLLRQLRFGQ